MWIISCTGRNGNPARSPIGSITDGHDEEDFTSSRDPQRSASFLCGHVVDLDIGDFFDQVNRETLMGLAGQVVKDRRVLGLLRGWSKAGVPEEGNLRYGVPGTPRGVIRASLSNLYLPVLDNASAEAGYRSVRYANDVRFSV